MWRKKTCEGEEFFIPAMKFYIKVYSEKGIQSIPEYLEAGIKEAIFERYMSSWRITRADDIF